MAACVILGNLAMNDKVCITMVENWRIHTTLKQLLESSKHSALLYAATGFLRHLAFPEANRTALGDAGVIEACQHVLLTHPTDAAVTGEVTALLGKLVTNNLPNIKRIVNDPPAPQQQTTCLQTLLTHSLLPATPLPSTSMRNPSIETGRTIVSILRYLARLNTTSPNDTNELHNTIFSIPHIATPIARLVRQRFYPEARAEGLLGLGLMAQSGEGAACVVEEMRGDGGLLDAVGEMAEEKDGKEGNEGGREYQNAMVLLQALRNHGGEGEGDDGLGGRIEEVMERLGRMMV